ncbi:MAG: hypothetical protein ACE5Q6_09375 [Dehalococcoidia bacterium]
MTPDELVEYLKEIPPAHLMLIDLAWELVGPDGAIDLNQTRYRMEDILMAKGEATAYAQGTHLMVEALKRCLKPDL